MFDKLKATKANKTTSSTKTKKDQPLTNRFVQELANANTRITYAALADASEQLGEHTPSGLSAGQRGSSIVKNLPDAVQPFVCRSGGGYKPGTAWPEAPEADIDQLKKLDRVGPNQVAAYVVAFQEAIGAENDSDDEDGDDEIEEFGDDSSDADDDPSDD